MTDVKEICSLIENLRQERDEALKQKKDLEFKVWQLEEQLRKQKEETKRWQMMSPK